MGEKVAVVSATGCDETTFWQTRPLGRSLRLLQKAFDCIEPVLTFESAEGLSTVYNRTLARLTVGSVETVVFVHDDVYLNDLFLFEKLDEGLRQYDLVGIAGSTCLNLDNPRVGWCECPAEFRAGGVFHPATDRQEGSFYPVCFGPSPRECLVIDGVFMALKLGSLGAVRFDERFTFDFYDLDFCLGLRAAGRRIGVLPILLTHLSLGAGFGGERHQALQKIFIEKHRRRDLAESVGARARRFAKRFRDGAAAGPPAGEYRLDNWPARPPKR